MSRKFLLNDTMVAYYFLLPAIIGFGIFTAVPLVTSLVISFYEWNTLSSPKFIGFGNFIKIFTEDKIFWIALENTFWYAVGVVPLSIALGLAAALLLNQKILGIALWRTVYFLPVMTSTVAISLVWKWLYNPDVGLINVLLREFGVQNPPTWLTSTTWALPSIIIVTIWKTIGYNMVIFLAGLQNVPKELYEAAEIDGSSKWNMFWKITLPLLRPTTFFITVISIIHSFQVFGYALIMTEGGPGASTNTLVLYIYQQGFKYFNMGYASAIAWVLFLILLIVTMIQSYVNHRREAA
ncbi:ABC transporter permease subunit [Paenibacillus sp. LMG 31456]|uniref:ABC transporter permease subunit n=1 Tax=Paenibacillus foliorum TaxID=2654974 RepID=A0A972GVS8_9BACL|nr:sugar ABC transporter permease [Paenibacillus foliorum]NOU97819.1 ABC transporter permease subunit [Paenibacillus foliorum]